MLVLPHKIVAALWKFLTLAQELLLLSLVNTKYMSQELVAVFQGGSFLDFNVFAPIFSLLPAEYQGEVGYNALDDNSQYHPTLAGKMFLVNLKCQICFALLSLLGFTICAVLGMRFPYFRKMSQRYLFNGLIDSMQASFIDAVLCAMVQIKNVCIHRALIRSSHSRIARSTISTPWQPSPHWRSKAVSSRSRST